MDYEERKQTHRKRMGYPVFAREFQGANNCLSNRTAERCGTRHPANIHGFTGTGKRKTLDSIKQTA